ncbi:MAG TPA: hypothetical protein VHB50_22925, partial [Bryobacteraceae bacterium]|nr:hypothetical protein [Bryobacteraceae bacterium]
DSDQHDHVFDTGVIRNIQFENSQPGPIRQTSTPSDEYKNARGPANAPSWTTPLTLPAGTEISVRVHEPLELQNSRTDRTWEAEVSRDIASPGGTIVVPRGSEARLVVRRLAGKEQLDLESISIGGHRLTVNAPEGAILAEYPGVTGKTPGMPSSTVAHVGAESNPVRLPAGAELGFRITRPVTLNPAK